MRTLLVLVALVCVAFWAIPAALDWAKWQYLEVSITQNMADIAASTGAPSVYLGVVRKNEFYLSNHEITWDASRRAMIDQLTRRRRDAVFVILPGSPGAWVNTPDEVIQFLKRETTQDRSTE